MTSQEFKKLQAQWYKKLEKKGFKDIECANEQLRSWDSLRFRSLYTPNEVSERCRYYELACQMLHDFKFKSPRDKRIWKKHCQGLTSTEIAKTEEVSDVTIRKVVKKYAAYIKR